MTSTCWGHSSGALGSKEAEDGLVGVVKHLVGFLNILALKVHRFGNPGGTLVKDKLVGIVVYLDRNPAILAGLLLPLAPLTTL